jgi:hypothetical protein
VSAAIDQERMMKVIAEADEKKRKRMTPRSVSSGSSSVAPPKYRLVYTPPRGQCWHLLCSSTTTRNYQCSTSP